MDDVDGEKSIGQKEDAKYEDKPMYFLDVFSTYTEQDAAEYGREHGNDPIDQVDLGFSPPIVVFACDEVRGYVRSPSSDDGNEASSDRNREHRQPQQFERPPFGVSV